MVKKRRVWLEKFHKSDHCLETNDTVLKKASSGSGDEAENSDRDDGIIKERRRKTRKLTRGLREFTGVPSEGERKCKGWSDEGMLVFEKHVMTIRKDVEDGRCVTWDKACREVMEKLGCSKKPNEELLKKARYKPNLGVVYEGF